VCLCKGEVNRTTDGAWVDAFFTTDYTDRHRFARVDMWIFGTGILRSPRKKKSVCNQCNLWLGRMGLVLHQSKLNRALGLFLHLLEAELAAGGVDVVAFLEAHGSHDA